MDKRRNPVWDVLVFGGALLLAAFLVWQALKGRLGREAATGAPPYESLSQPSRLRKAGGPATESGVTFLPPIRLSQSRGMRRRVAVPVPAPPPVSSKH